MVAMALRRSVSSRLFAACAAMTARMWSSEAFVFGDRGRSGRWGNAWSTATLSSLVSTGFAPGTSPASASAGPAIYGWSCTCAPRRASGSTAGCGGGCALSPSTGFAGCCLDMAIALRRCGTMPFVFVVSVEELPLFLRVDVGVVLFFPPPLLDRLPVPVMCVRPLHHGRGRCGRQQPLHRGPDTVKRLVQPAPADRRLLLWQRLDGRPVHTQDLDRPPALLFGGGGVPLRRDRSQPAELGAQVELHRCVDLLLRRRRELGQCRRLLAAPE